MVNPEELKRICDLPFDEFAPLGVKVGVSHEQRYIYIDNGSDILGVAHLDTVQSKSTFHACDIGDDRVFFSPKFDDRLGAYVLLSLLPSLGVKCDVLLTDNEEKGASSAQFFRPKKQYKWMFMFDRSGTDVVMYDYGDEAYTQLLKDNGFTSNNFGAYSCIRELLHLGCRGFNFAVGYYDNHSPRGYAVESNIMHNVNLFVPFYEKYKDTAMPFVLPPAICYDCGCARKHYDGLCQKCEERYTATSHHYNRPTKKDLDWLKHHAPVVCTGCGIPVFSAESRAVNKCAICRWVDAPEGTPPAPVKQEVDEVEDVDVDDDEREAISIMGACGMCGLYRKLNDTYICLTCTQTLESYK